MVGEMPGGKPCWFKVPSLEQVLLLVLEGFQPRHTPQHQIALRLSWGPSGEGLFSLAHLDFVARSPAYRICCLYGWGFISVLPKPEQLGSTRSKLGTQILPPEFPGA